MERVTAPAEWALSLPRSYWIVDATTNDPKAQWAATMLHAAMTEGGFPLCRATAVAPYDDDPDNSVTLGSGYEMGYHHIKGVGQQPTPVVLAWQRAWSLVRQAATYAKPGD